MPKNNNPPEVVTDEDLALTESEAIDSALEGIPDLEPGAQIPSPPQRAAKAKEEQSGEPTPKPAKAKAKEPAPPPPADDKKKKGKIEEHPAPPPPAEKKKPAASEPPQPPEGKPVDPDKIKIQTDEEIEAELAAAPKPKFQSTKEENAWIQKETKIRELNRARRAEAERTAKLERELEDLRKQVPSEEDRKQVQSMREYFQNTAVEQMVVPKYQQKLGKIHSDVVTLLAEAGLPKESIDYINQRGGPFVFSESDNPMGKTTEGEWFEEEVYSRMSRAQRATFDKLLGEASTALRERDRELQTGRQHKNEYLSKREKETRAAFEQITQARWKERADELPAFIPREPIPIPDDATPEERAELEEENKILTEAGEYAKKNVLVIAAKDRADVAFDGAYAKYLQFKLIKTLDKYEAEKKRADELQEELDAIENASDFRQARNAAPPPERESDNKGKSTEEVLDAEFG